MGAGHLDYGMKLGGGSVSTGWLVENITARNTRSPAYLHDIHDSTFRRLDLEAAPTGTRLNHALYINANVQDSLFEDIRLTKPSGYAFHIDANNGTSPTARLVFRRLVADASASGRPMVMASGGIQQIRFYDLTAIGGNRGDRAALMLGTPSDLLVEGFQSTGSDYFIRQYNGTSADGVTLRNGNVNGVRIDYGSPATRNLAIESVSVGGAPYPVASTKTGPSTTATAPSTASTAVPTATTKAAPITTATEPATTTSTSGGSVSLGGAAYPVARTATVGRSATPGPFPDVPSDHLFAGFIETLKEEGMVSGYLDGRFGLNDHVLRAQFTKIVVRAVGLHTAEDEYAGRTSFSDVPGAGEYPHDYVEEAVRQGIVSGRADGTFGPFWRVTRAQLAAMVVRAAGGNLARPAVLNAGFSDMGNLTPEFKAAIAIAKHNRILGGYPDGTYRPHDYATRGQMAKMVYFLRQKI
ncbi:MAG TPA: S-layer homology domain-containing protein [Thermoleophilia bacterium]|nr:S-layer homology domain-containing protein [Thermoleophilia bacterium]